MTLVERADLRTLRRLRGGSSCLRIGIPAADNPLAADRLPVVDTEVLLLVVVASVLRADRLRAAATEVLLPVVADTALLLAAAVTALLLLVATALLLPVATAAG